MAPADTASDTAPASATPAAGLTVIIGTRDAAALADAIAAGRSAARTVIALPEPGAAALLEARLAGRADVQLIAAAIGRPPGGGDGAGGDGAGGDGGEAALLVFNAPGLVSLCPPTGLADLMPGLRVVARPRVPVIAPAAFLARIGPVARPFRLVIDAPGAEGDILEALAAAGLAGALDRLEVHCGAAPLVEGAWGRAAVEAWAATQGFARIALDLADPDFPALAFAPDRVRRELAEARAQMQAQGRALAEARAQAEAKDKALAEARAQAEAKDKALAEARAQAEAKDKALAEARAQAEAQGKALAEARAQAEAQGKARAQAEGRGAQLAEENQRRGLDLRAMQRDLGLALRLQATAQASLAELQDRYAALLATKERQDDLLRQLTPRLQEAARQLQAMPMPGQTEGPGQTEEPDSTGRTGKKRHRKAS